MEKSRAMRKKMLMLSSFMLFLGVLFGVGGITCFVLRYADDPYDPLNDDDTYLTYIAIVLLASAVTMLPTWLMILRGVMKENPSLIPSGACLFCFVGLLCQSTVSSYREALLEDLAKGNNV
eukprot:TRINITY_DN12447_c0_g1_i1.p1 TRINITY_DN12447_c0_g1~~TRINITY_DN12447_c0_g1_i1.p1  ORF type:complete len:121 (-),score=17.36 TRINITY_DN12447_c0_g1_i1:389-751(-)